MIDTIDILRVQPGGVLWLESAATLECAQVRVKQLAQKSPGEYILLDQRTGNKHVMKLASIQELPLAEPEPMEMLDADKGHEMRDRRALKLDRQDLSRRFDLGH